MIEGLDLLKPCGKTISKKEISTISRGRDSVNDVFKIKKKHKSRPDKQLEK